MGDVVGRLFHEFAITLAATIVISAVVSLTLVPMLCAKLLTPERGRRAAAAITPPAGASSRGCCAWYGRALDVVLNHQPTTLLVALATFVLTGYLYVDDPQGILSDPGHRRHPGRHPGRRRTSRSPRWRERQQELADVILHDADVDSLSSFIGVDGSNVTLNSGRFLDQPQAARPAHSRRQRDHPPPAAARPPTSPASRCYMQPVQDLSIDTAVSATQYQFTLENQDLATLQTWTPKVLDAARARSPRSSTSPAICSRTAAR